MESFTQQDWTNIMNLISAAPITGKEAVVVALLQQKIHKMIEPQAEGKAEAKKEGTPNPTKNAK